MTTMLAAHLFEVAMSRPVVFFLHSLGASRREWDQVQGALGDRVECIALDIPGFGGTPAGTALSIDVLVDWFEAEVAERAPACWFVVGHSMGGKIATLTAARSREGAQGLAGLAGVVLVAASPPCPEPMDEDRRTEMLSWFGPEGPSRQNAETFIDANTHQPLTGPVREKAIADVLRTEPAAWCAWLQEGSRQHRQEQAGKLMVPALILAGAEDGDLGEDAQRALNAPHYVHADVHTVPGAAHLIPLEQPQWLAQRIAQWVEPLRTRALPPAFVDLLNAERVAPRMRARLLARHATPPMPAALAAHHATLVALAACVVPGADAHDLALRVANALADGEGDGWRFADLPADGDAWTLALRQLEAEGVGFAAMDATQQQAMLSAIVEQRAAPERSNGLDAQQWARWFEDARALFARTWMSLPSTWATIGYDGFAVGGGGANSPGYQHTEAGSVDAWQLPC